MQKIKLQLIFPTLLLCVLAAAAGCITGALTAGFGRVLLWIGTFRTEHLISCVPFLPIAGVCMVWIYQKYGRESSQGMSLIFDAADGTAGVHRAVFYPRAAAAERIYPAEDHRSAPAAGAAVRRDALVAGTCEDGFSRHRAGPHRPAGARESAGARRADPRGA